MCVCGGGGGVVCVCVWRGRVVLWRGQVESS